MLFACIVWLKLVSYAHTNYDMRSLAKSVEKVTVYYYMELLLLSVKQIDANKLDVYMIETCTYKIYYHVQKLLYNILCQLSLLSLWRSPCFVIMSIC